jgi:8-oxo-dGTP pyrophosphatase MutT (NUDIX family)
MAKVVNEIIEVCVFRRLARGTEYLLLQRSANEDVYPNMWQIVTGTLQQNETALHGALREFSEETNLSVLRLWNVPYASSFYVVMNDTIQIAPLFAVEVDSKCEVTLSPEHQKFEWLPFYEAHDRLVWPAQQEGIKVVNEYIVGGKAAASVTEIIHPPRKD